MEVGNVSAKLQFDYSKFAAGLRESSSLATAFQSQANQTFGRLARDIEGALAEVGQSVRDLGRVYLEQKQIDRDLAESARVAAAARQAAAAQARDAARAAAQAAREAADADRKALAEVEAAQRKAAEAARAAAKSQEEALGRVKAGLQAVGLAAGAAGAAIAKGLTESGKGFIEFDGALRNVNSIAKLSESQLAVLKEQLLALPRAEQLTQGPTALTRGLYDIVSSGFAASDAMHIMTVSARAADAGLTDAAVASDVMTSTLNAFHLGANQAQRVSDVLFKTVDKGKVTFEQLAQNMGSVTSTAAFAGVSLEEMSAALAVLTINGIKAPEAAVALNDAILKLTAPTKEAKKVMQALNIEIDENTIRTRGLAYALDLLVTKTGHSQEVLHKIIDDQRALKAVQTLGESGATQLKEFTRANAESSGATAAARAQQAQSLATQLKVIFASLESAAIRVGNVIAPLIAKGAAFIDATALAFERLSPAMQQFTVIAATVASAASLLAGALVFLAPGITAIAGLFAEGTIAAGAATIGTAISGLAAPVAIAAAAIAALYAAWKTNFGGIQQIAAAGWETIKSGFAFIATEAPRLWSQMWASIVQTARAVWEEIRPAVTEGIEFIATAWAELYPIIAAALQVIVPFVRGAFQNLYEAVRTVLAVLREAWGVAWEFIKGTVATAWPIIKNTVLLGLNAVKNIVQIVSGVLQGDWRKVWDAIKDIAANAVTLLTDAVQSTFDAAVTALGAVGERMFNAAASIPRRIAAGILSQAQVVQDAIYQAIYGTQAAQTSAAFAGAGSGAAARSTSGLSPEEQIEQLTGQKVAPPQAAGAASDTPGFNASISGAGTVATQLSRQAEAKRKLEAAENAKKDARDAARRKASEISNFLTGRQNDLNENLATAGTEHEARLAAYRQSLKELEDHALRDEPKVLQKAKDIRVAIAKELVAQQRDAEKQIVDNFLQQQDRYLKELQKRPSLSTDSLITYLRQQQAEAQRLVSDLLGKGAPKTDPRVQRAQEQAAKRAEQIEEVQDRQAAARISLERRVQEARLHGIDISLEGYQKEGERGIDASAKIIAAVQERIRIQFGLIDAAAQKEREANADTAEARTAIDEEVARKRAALLDSEKKKVLEIIEEVKKGAADVKALNAAGGYQPGNTVSAFKLPEFTNSLPYTGSDDIRIPYDQRSKNAINTTPLQTFANSLDALKGEFTNSANRLVTSLDNLSKVIANGGGAQGGGKSPAPGAGSTGTNWGGYNTGGRAPSTQSTGTGAAAGQAYSGHNPDGSYGAPLPSDYKYTPTGDPRVNHENKPQTVIYQTEVHNNLDMGAVRPKAEVTAAVRTLGDELQRAYNTSMTQGGLP